MIKIRKFLRFALDKHDRGGYNKGGTVIYSD